MTQQTDQQTIFETTVVEIGGEAEGFKDINMAILFGDEAPEALRSSCYIIKVNPVRDAIKPGMTLSVDDKTYQITAIGNEAQKNLENLGHVAVNFTGDQTPELAGSVYVEAKAYPEIKVGSRIAIG